MKTIRSTKDLNEFDASEYIDLDNTIDNDDEILNKFKKKT